MERELNANSTTLEQAENSFGKAKEAAVKLGTEKVKILPPSATNTERERTMV